jgi:hypothetical protein
MIATAHPIPSSAAAHAPARSTLELLEARQLCDALKNLLRREQAALADFLVALADFDRRRGWEPLGHASFFAFLHFELGLSNGAAFHRMSAARLLQRFPDLIEPFRDGQLCLSTAAELSKVVTEANRAEVAPRFFGLSAREAQEVVAGLQPRAAPPLRAVVTSLAMSPFASGPSQATALVRPATLPGPSAGSSALDGSSDTDSESLLTSEEEWTHPARDAAPRRVPAHAPPDLPRAPPATRSSRSPPTCAGSTSPSAANSWRSSTPPAMGSPTPSLAPPPSRSSMQRSTCSSRSRPGPAGG